MLEQRVTQASPLPSPVLAAAPHGLPRTRRTVCRAASLS